MNYLSFVIYLVLTWVTIHLLVSTVKKLSKPRNIPPGPYPLPIFGNLFCLGNKPHISLTELAKRYGPLMMLQLGQVPTVVISSAAVAKEAHQKNDQSLANRYVVDAIRALNHHQYSIGWLPATSSEWRNLRKVCNSLVFSPSKLDETQSLRRDKINDLLTFVERSSSKGGKAVDIGQVAFTTSLNLLSSAFFSMDLGDPSSEYACQLRETIRSLLEEVGKPNFADHFPILQKIDPQGIRRRATVLSKKVMDLLKIIIDQRLQGKRPSSSIQGYDVLDALLGISHHDKNQELMEPSKIPHLLLV